MHDLLDKGIMQHNTSPFASPIILVRKKDRSWCLCMDFRRLNELTTKDCFPVPLMDELSDLMVFSNWICSQDTISCA